MNTRAILRPASRLFIALSLLIGLLLSLFPWVPVIWLPDFLLLVLCFWLVREPQSINIGFAFMLGLVMDVHKGTLLGQTALIYSMVAYLITLIHLRLASFNFSVQTVYLLPIFLVAHCIALAVHLLQGDALPATSYWLTPFIHAVLWPLVAFLLIIPQCLVHEKDYTRSI